MLSVVLQYCSVDVLLPMKSVIEEVCLNLKQVKLEFNMHGVFSRCFCSLVINLKKNTPLHT